MAYIRLLLQVLLYKSLFILHKPAENITNSSENGVFKQLNTILPGKLN